jgi:hypothetical protein
MATESQKLSLAELAAAGYVAHEVVNYLTKAKLQNAEINAFIRLTKAGAGVAARSLARVPGTAIGLAARGAGAARFFAMRHPAIALVGTAGIIYVKRDQIGDMIAQGYEMIPEGAVVGDPGAFPPVRPGPLAVYVPPAKIKRAVSKANKAVKQGMTWLKAGTRATSGALPGKLPRGAFKIAVKAAGMANPKTKSRIGKGKSIMNKLARRLKKWW